MDESDFLRQLQEETEASVQENAFLDGVYDEEVASQVRLLLLSHFRRMLRSSEYLGELIKYILLNFKLIYSLFFRRNPENKDRTNGEKRSILQ